MSGSSEVTMSVNDFERFSLIDTPLSVSICRTCLQFIAAARDPMRLVIAETLHHCAFPLKKPPVGVLPQLRRMRSSQL
jgi:hypothetical protein